MTILVTGGAGFIGSNFIERQLSVSDEKIVNIDLLTYAGNIEHLAKCADNPNYEFVKADICDRETITRVLAEYNPRGIIHFAAESHVDNSIENPKVFLETNILGTFNLLECSRRYESNNSNDFRFLHISTDEVFGSLSATDDAFTEKHKYAPNSPYSASKASSDHMVRAYHETYGLNTVITNCSNNYGKHQHIEKLIPKTILNAIGLKPIPIYGDGLQIRDWLNVADHCSALSLVFEEGMSGETYNIGGNCELTNLKLVNMICDILDEVKPIPKTVDMTSYKELITHVQDRAGHDTRYAIDMSYISKELGWSPNIDIEKGLRDTIIWYLAR